ncbi:MAG: AraC family transcriptional regulator [Pseudomonadota bacterium]
MSETRRDLYERRMTRAIAHMHDHLDGDLSLDALAEVAGVSRFHFHRLYRAMIGETTAATIRRIRLNRAALLLIESTAPVPDIARRCGYTNQRSFAHAFQTAFGTTPTAFRRESSAVPVLAPPERGDVPMTTPTPIEITDRPAIHLAAVLHRGPYTKVGRAFETLMAILSNRGLWPATHGMSAVYYDDPMAEEPNALRAHAGALVAADFAVPEGLEAVSLAGGRHAVMRYKGPYAGLNQAYQHLYGTWLPSSGHEPANAPPYEIYVNDPRTVAPTDLLTDIHVPLA